MALSPQELQESIPKGLQGLQANKQYVGDIINYCDGTIQQTPELNPVIQKTKKYVEDSTAAIAENIFYISSQLTTFLQFQEEELTRLGKRIQSISLKLQEAELHTAKTYLTEHQKAREAPKRRLKLRVLRGNELPALAMPKQAFNHGRIDLNYLENVGTGNEAGGSLEDGPSGPGGPPTLMAQESAFNLLTQGPAGYATLRASMSGMVGGFGSVAPPPGMGAMMPPGAESKAGSPPPIQTPDDPMAPPMLSSLGGGPPLLSSMGPPLLSSRGPGPAPLASPTGSSGGVKSFNFAAAMPPPALGSAPSPTSSAPLPPPEPSGGFGASLPRQLSNQAIPQSASQPKIPSPAPPSGGFSAPAAPAPAKTSLPPPPSMGFAVPPPPSGGFSAPPPPPGGFNAPPPPSSHTNTTSSFSPPPPPSMGFGAPPPPPEISTKSVPPPPSAGFGAPPPPTMTRATPKVAVSTPPPPTQHRTSIPEAPPPSIPDAPPEAPPEPPSMSGAPAPPGPPSAPDMDDAPSRPAPSSSGGGGRGGLLDAIRAGKKLKKAPRPVENNDMAGKVIDPNAPKEPKKETPAATSAAPAPKRGGGPMSMQEEMAMRLAKKKAGGAGGPAPAKTAAPAAPGRVNIPFPGRMGGAPPPPPGGSMGAPPPPPPGDDNLPPPPPE